MSHRHWQISFWSFISAFTFTVMIALFFQPSLVFGQEDEAEAQSYLVRGVHHPSQQDDIARTGAVIEAVGQNWIEISASPEQAAAVQALGYGVEQIVAPLQAPAVYLPLILGEGNPSPPLATLASIVPEYLSLANSGSYAVGGVPNVRDEDILSFDGTNFAMVFDGSDVGVGGLDLDAFDRLDADSFLMSFHNAATIGSLGTVDDADIVRFDATSLGSTTAGAFSLFFDGSAVGLEVDNNAEDVDAVELLPDGRLLISTGGSTSVPGVSAKDEDLLAFTPASPGNYGSGSWSMYFDGSDVGLNTSSSEDVNGVTISGGVLYLSTLGSFAVAGVSGAAEDVFVCTPVSLGNTTNCLFSSSLAFDGSAKGLAGNDVDGIAVSTNLPGLAWKPYLQQLTDTSVIIQWTTWTGASPQVRYSTDTSYGAVANGTSRPLPTLTTQLHRVQLSGLQPNTTYYYKIFTEGQDMLPAETLSFRAAPSPGSATPFTFLAFGDYGQDTPSQKRLRDQMVQDSFNFILTTGDNAYGKGTYYEYDAKVFQIYRDIFSRAAVFITLGNHEYQTSNAAPSLDLFDLPAQALRLADQERYYSFDYGNVHFVALDSNTPLDATDSAASDDMFDWLRQDLSQTSQPWKIVAFHHPAYSTGIHSSDPRVQSKLVPIFETYGVDLVLTGHDHTYQRTHPLKGGQITPTSAGGIIYIVSGAGSATSYFCFPASWLATALCGGDYGLYNRITVAGNTLTIETIDESGAVRDNYTITQ